MAPAWVEDQPLAELTTLGAGGHADRFADTTSASSVVAALEERDGGSLVLLGSGSNVVIADAGLRGTTIRLRTSAPAWTAEGDVVDIDGAAELDDAIVSLAAGGHFGLEALSGIPGTVGAAVVQNVGAYGYEIAELIERVTVFDLVEGTTRDLAPHECGFGYRTSRFKKAELHRFVVLGCRLRTSGEPVHEIRYDEVARELGAGPKVASEDARQAVLTIRRRKRMVYERPDDPRSAGSFFTNPVIDEAAFERLPGDVPHWQVAEGVKVSGGWLIEQAGFSKGQRFDGVGLGEAHALSLVNLEPGHPQSAARILTAAGRIIGQVRDRFGVTLEIEPVLLGFTDDELRGFGVA